MQKPIRNKVAEAGLITVDLLDYIPKENIKGIDLKDWLINGLIIKEQDFKNKLDNFDFFPFENCNVYIYCSKDVIIPVWAFLLLQVKLNSVANYVFFGTNREAFI